MEEQLHGATSTTCSPEGQEVVNPNTRTRSAWSSATPPAYEPNVQVVDNDQHAPAHGDFPGGPIETLSSSTCSEMDGMATTIELSRKLVSDTGAHARNFTGRRQADRWRHSGDRTKETCHEALRPQSTPYIKKTWLNSTGKRSVFALKRRKFLLIRQLRSTMNVALGKKRDVEERRGCRISPLKRNRLLR